MESDGFDMGDYPLFSNFGVITRLHYPPDKPASHEMLIALKYSSRLAIQQFNKAQKTKFRNVVVLKANVQPLSPYRPSVPELHQASQAPPQVGASTHPKPPVMPAEVTQSESSSVRASEPSSSQLTQELQQISLKPESSSIEAAQPNPANHFVVELLDKDLHQYDVTISPEVSSRGVNRAVMKQLVKLYRNSHLGNRLPVYDGRKSLYAAGPLPFVNKEFKIVLTDEDDGSGGGRRERDFKVVIKLASRVDMHHLKMFLKGSRDDAPQEALQVLDIVLRELPTSRFSPVGRSFYAPDIGSKPLGEGLESWRGFYQSIRPTRMGLSLNIADFIDADMSTTAFIEPLPVIEFNSQLLNTDFVEN
ncbi:hypothetical protein POM88_030569 [Heracleum sosnowskyi]|uniref:Argonaute linker 1 domain-containing protein n=1 Tax=Heracleum sosnowskyi TaxID=360622 RepID=A0AAD8HW60_9APIA|nr:hypothetical protein POM88_030569 [Heracleum sosnowskyi]